MLNVSKRTAYMILAISIVIEIIGDAMLTASNGYEHRLLGIGAVITILFSFSCFPKTLHIIDLPIAYATWSVVGGTGMHAAGSLFLPPAPFAHRLDIDNHSGCRHLHHEHVGDAGRGA